MSSPTVSIVIPTFQRAATIDRLLRSLSDAPPTTEFEVIVVDNASTDGTDAVVAAAAERLPTLQFHRWEENLGPLENWRRGIERASGHWLKIIWSDDWVEPGAIDRLVSTAVSTGSTTVTCGARLHHSDHTVDWYTTPVDGLTPDTAIRALLKFPSALPASPTAALVRREQAYAGLTSVKLCDGCASSAIGPDVVLTYWDTFNGEPGVHITEPLVNFGLPDDSITLSSRRGKLLGCYANSMWALLDATGAEISSSTMRSLRHRGTFASLLGGPKSDLPHNRRFSLRAAAADASDLTRYTISQRRGSSK